MTNELISRQAAIDALNERCESECEYSKKQRSVMCNACYLGSAKEVVENLPTIDPVKHGKWIPVNERAAKCSLCGEWEYTNGKDKTGTAIIHRAIKHYCPNCGAKMEEK